MMWYRLIRDAWFPVTSGTAARICAGALRAEGGLRLKEDVDSLPRLGITHGSHPRLGELDLVVLSRKVVRVELFHVGRFTGL